MCRVTCEDAIIVFEENQRTMRFLNTHRRSVEKVKVDGCLLREGRKCDYLLIDHEQKEYYVELKGIGVLHAFDQIEATVQQISQQTTQLRQGFVIATRVMPNSQSRIQVRQSQLKEKGIIVMVKNRQHEHRLG